MLVKIYGHKIWISYKIRTRPASTDTPNYLADYQYTTDAQSAQHVNLCAYMCASFFQNYNYFIELLILVLVIYVFFLSFMSAFILITRESLFVCTL